MSRHRGLRSYRNSGNRRRGISVFRRSSQVSAEGIRPCLEAPVFAQPAPQILQPRVSPVVGMKPRNRPKRGALLPTISVYLPLILSAYLLAQAGGSRPHPWLGLLSLLPLFRAIQVSRPWPALAAGAVWGASLYVFIIRAAEAGLPSGVESFMLLVTIPAVYAGLGAWITRRVGFSPFVLGVAWMLVELALRPLALHRGLLAGTQGDGLLIGPIGRPFGYLLVAFVVAFAGASLLALLSGIRIRLGDQTISVGPDIARRWLWHVVSSKWQACRLCMSQPRAPPAFPPCESRVRV